MSRKLKFVISDLHLGAGFAHQHGNYLEDFTADDKLVQFLREIGQESEQDQCEIELIINGDFFEFLQVPAEDEFDPQVIYPRKVYFESTEQASVKRLNLIIAGHQEIFNALSDFMHVEKPQRRITVIKGNHDVNLFWPGVKSRLRDALGATGPRASLLLFAEEFVSREKIYVEHGHQRTEKINNFPDFLDPRLPDQPTQLNYPAGSRFVINFFNEVEHRYWFVDSIKPMTTLIWYGFRWDFSFAAKTLASFIRYAPDLVLGALAEGDSAASPAETLIHDLEDDDARHEIMRRYADEPDFRQEFHQRVQRYLGGATIPNKSISAFSWPEVGSDPVAAGQAMQKHQHSVLHQAAEAIAAKEGAQVILFGHTHRPLAETLNGGGVYINTGCWLWSEDFSDAPPEVWAALFNGSQQPGDKLGRLPYARIDYDEHGNPTAKLLDFSGKDTASAPKSEMRGFFERIYRWLAGLLGIGKPG